MRHWEGAGRGRSSWADSPILRRHTNKGACDDAPTALFPVGLFPNCFTINRAAHPDKDPMSEVHVLSPFHRDEN